MHYVHYSYPNEAFLAKALRPFTPARKRSNVGTVLSQEIQASVTDCPYLMLERPLLGMSCRPSTKFDSIMTPMIWEDVSSDSSCRACNSIRGKGRSIKALHSQYHPRPLFVFRAAWNCFRGCNQSDQSAIRRNEKSRRSSTDHDFLYHAGFLKFFARVTDEFGGVIGP